MKILSLISILFLTACSSTKPKLVVRPQEPSAPANADVLRYPEVTRTYYVGRYVDPGSDSLLHEEHVVYRVEANAHWNFHPLPPGYVMTESVPSRDPAFAPMPVNDAILAEVNAQKAATAAVVAQASQLSGALRQFQSALGQTKVNLEETAALRTAIEKLDKRLSMLEVARETPSVTTNAVPDPFPP